MAEMEDATPYSFRRLKEASRCASGVLLTAGAVRRSSCVLFTYVVLLNGLLDFLWDSFA